MDRNGFFNLLKFRPAGELQKIQSAYWLGKRAHEHQTRDTGERYFEHPRAAALILVEHGIVDTETVIVALLHDVIEDTFVPGCLLVDLFGAETYHSVLLLSKKVPVVDLLTGEIIAWGKKDADDYYQNIAEARKTVRLVKCADRLHNLRSCTHWERERKERYIAETLKYIMPIAGNTDIRFSLELADAVAALRKSLVVC